MVDLVHQLREDAKTASPESLRVMCGWGADQIERLTERCTAYKGQVEAGAHVIEQMRVALKEIQAYSVGNLRSRHTWYYDRAEAALSSQQKAARTTNCPYCGATPTQEHDPNCGLRHLTPVR